jgi:hypothetical protein
VQALDFAIVERLHFPEHSSYPLFRVVIRKNVAEPFQVQNIGRQFVSPQHWTEFWCRSRYESKPYKSRKHCRRITKLMIFVELFQRINRRPFLASQSLPHLRTVGTPIVRTHISFISGGIKRTHRREHGLIRINCGRRGGCGFRFWQWRRGWRGAFLALGDDSGHGQDQQNHTNFIYDISSHLLFALLGCSLKQHARPGRFMRLGWRYQQMIRTFRNHAAASSSQCTGAPSVSQGSVFGLRIVKTPASL